MDERCWRIGELAAATGLTVRALHHFDQIGLLRPARRTPAGHRVYTAGDVRRLYRILALRQLGMPLGRIGRSLDGDLGDLGSAVRAQLAQVEERMETQRRLRERLTALRDAVDQVTEPSLDELIETMEAMMKARYFTPEQLAEARRRHEEPGFAERFAGWKRRAAAIAGALGPHLDRGTDPADPSVQELARQWTAVLRDMAGGDMSVVSAIYAKIEGKGPVVATQGVLTDPVWEYLRLALAVGFDPGP